MLTYHVSQDGTGEFTRIMEAIEAVPYDTAATIYLAAGTYREKIFCEKKELRLVGEDKDNTKIIWGDGAMHLDSSGNKLRTFRTYTAFFGGQSITLENLTIENDAGPGHLCGQAIAAYMDATDVLCRNVAFIGHQDTLFMAPLPEKEHEAFGFMGPRRYTERLQTSQRYENCLIMGSVDFIFGGADARFDRCRIICRALDEGEHGYIAAPSTLPDHRGLVFFHCVVAGEKGCKQGSYYLARAWRKEGKAAFISCTLGDVIHPEGYCAWNETDDERDVNFSEFECNGPGASVERTFGRQLDREQATCMTMLNDVL